MSVISIPEPQSFDSLLALGGKVAIVTGGSRGIGEQVVRRFAQAGASVAFTARGADALQKVEAALSAEGFTAAGIQADVGQVSDSRRVVQTAVERFGRLDILVNNAAVFPGSTGLEMTEEIWDETFDTDTKGAFFMAQIAAQQMIAQGAGGQIINFLSTAALNPTPILFAYGAAMSALWYVTQTLATELAPHHILVNAVTPGGTMTTERAQAFASGTLVEHTLGKQTGEMLEHLQGGAGVNFEARLKQMAPLGRPGHLDDLAKAVLFLASPMAAYISGVNITVDGAQSLKNPALPNLNAPQSSADDTTNTSPAGNLDSSLDGAWKATLNSPMGTQEVLFRYHVQGEELTGTVTLLGEEVPIENGHSTTTGFTHEYRMNSPVGKIKVRVTGTVDGDTITGSLKIPVGTLPYEAKRA